jgi:uncharacterized protein
MSAIFSGSIERVQLVQGRAKPKKTSDDRTPKLTKSGPNGNAFYTQRLRLCLHKSCLSKWRPDTTSATSGAGLELTRLVSALSGSWPKNVTQQNPKPQRRVQTAHERRLCWLSFCLETRARLHNVTSRFARETFPVIPNIMVIRRVAVRTSPIHGRGVFALTRISKDEALFEYKGKLLASREAQRRFERSGAEDGHTFYFDLGDGRVIDGAQGGNAARWVNHSCEPNCETEQDGDRVFFHALRVIEPGEELFIDYRLHVDGRKTKALKALYQCRCAAKGCRGTMLA